jgi:hypothetical protein
VFFSEDGMDSVLPKNAALSYTGYITAQMAAVDIYIYIYDRILILEANIAGCHTASHKLGPFCGAGLCSGVIYNKLHRLCPVSMKCYI